MTVSINAGGLKTTLTGLFLLCCFGMAPTVSAQGLEGADIYDQFYQDDTSDTLNEITDTPSQAHNFHHTADEDWFKLVVIEPVGPYTISVTNVGEDCDVGIYLYENGLDQAPTERDRVGTGAGRQENLGFTPEEPGTYTVQLKYTGRASDPVDPERMAYDLKVTRETAGVLPKMTLDGLRVDDSGSSSPDGNAAPGESVLVFAKIMNIGGETGFNTTGEMTAVTEGLTVDPARSSQEFGDVAPGQTVENEVGYQITIPSTASTGDTIHLLLRVSYQVGISGQRAVSMIQGAIEVAGDSPGPSGPANAAFEVLTDPADWVVDTPVVFDASASTGEFAAYQWQIVGGETETTTSPIYSKVFDTPGSKTILLNLIDASGAVVAGPAFQQIDIQAAGGVLPKLVFSKVRVDDSASSMPNGKVDAGETVLLFVKLRNDGGETAYNTLATLKPVTSGVTVDSSREEQSFGDIPPGGTSENEIGFQITAPANLTENDMVQLQILASYQVGIGGRRGFSLVTFAIPKEGTGPDGDPEIVFSGHRLVRDIVPGQFRSGDGVINPGETISLMFRVTNRGNGEAAGLTATLQSNSPEAVVNERTLEWNAVAAGESAFSRNSIDLSIADSAEFNKPLSLTVNLNGPGVVQNEVPLELWVLRSVNVGPVNGNGIQPTGMAYVPSVNRFYVANVRSNNVSVVDPTVNQVVACIPVGRDPDSMVYDEAGNRVFIGHRSIPLLTAIDPDTNTIVSQLWFEEAGGVSDLAVDTNMGFLLVAHDDIDQITVIKLSDLSIVGRLGEISSLGRITYSSFLSNLLYIDPNQGTIISGGQQLFIDGTTRGDTLAVDNRQGIAYLGGRKNGEEGLFSVSLTDGRTNFLPLGQQVRALAVHPVTGIVYAGLVTTADNPRTLVAINPTTGAITASSSLGNAFSTILVGSGPYTGRLLITESLRYQVHVVDSNTLKLRGLVVLGNSPQRVAVDHANGRVYVTNRDTFMISALDSVSGRLLESFLAGSRPGGLAFDPTRQLVYAALEGEDAVLELSSAGVLRRLRALKVGPLPVEIALDTVRRRVIVTNALEGGMATWVDPTTGDIQSVQTGQEPSGVVANEALGRFYVAAKGSSELFAFNTDDATLLKGIKLDPNDSPAALALDPETNRVFAGMLGPQEVWAFDADLNRIATITADVGDIINDVDVDSTRRRLYVSALLSGQLRVYNLDTFEFIRAVDIGRAPFGIDVDEETAMAYVAAEVGGVVTFYKDPDKVLPSLPPPGSLLPSAGDSRVSLVWSTVEGSKGYVVERSQAGFDAFVPITSTPLPPEITEFSDTDVLNGVGYRYQVRAVGEGRLAGAPTQTDVVYPQQQSDPRFTFSIRSRHVRVAPGEEGRYSMSLRPKGGFLSPISFMLQGGTHPRISSTFFTPGNLPAPGAPSSSKLRVAVATQNKTYAKLPLQVQASSPVQTESEFLFLEVLPPKQESEDSRDKKLKSKGSKGVPVILTTDVDSEDPAPSTVTVKGEVGTPDGEAALDLSVTKPDGSKVDISGVLVKDGNFAQTIPVGGADDFGNWKVNASFGGNDVSPSGQSSTFILPIASSAAKRGKGKSIAQAGPGGLFGIGTLIVAAGAPSQMRSQEFTDALVSRVEGIMRKRRYTNSSLRVLSAADQTLTNRNLKTAIQEAGVVDPLVLYILGDTDNSGRFVLGNGETITATELEETLSTSRGQRPSIILVDGHRAEAFAGGLDPSCRVVIASTGSGAKNIAIFTELSAGGSGGNGSAPLAVTPDNRAQISFSNFFFDAINQGKGIQESFAYASREITALQGAVQLQVPHIHVGNEELSMLPIGSAVDTGAEELADRIPPTIDDISPTQNARSDQAELVLEAEVSDNRGIARVTAVVGEMGSGTETKLTMEAGSEAGRFRVTISSEHLPQDAADKVLIPVSVVAEDTSGNLAQPVLTSILIEDTGIARWWNM